MALINCPECGKEISDSAINCPNCGYPVNLKKKKSLKIVYIGIGILLIIGAGVLISQVLRNNNTNNKTEESFEQDLDSSSSSRPTPVRKSTEKIEEDTTENFAQQAVELTNDEVACIETVLKEIEKSYSEFYVNAIDLYTLHNVEIDEIYDQEIYIIQVDIDTSVLNNTYYLWSDTHAFSALSDYPALLEVADIVEEKHLDENALEATAPMLSIDIPLQNGVASYSESKQKSIQLSGKYKNTSKGLTFEFDGSNISISSGGTALKGTYVLEEGFLKITLASGDYYSFGYSSTAGGIELQDESGERLVFEKE